MHKSQTETVVSIQHLVRRFEDKVALDNVSIRVAPGQVFGIVGENGAGKTTLIKHILGLYQAQAGTVEVFGLNPVQRPETVLARIGYLSEEPDMPAWMRVSELLRYMGAFYPSWDDAYARELLDLFGIAPSLLIRNLSKGMRAQVGLCVAQAHRPDLLLLDEPSSGLDPNVRRDILSAIIRTVVDEGRTVIFSSHLLDEVERVSDHLMMLRKGQVLLSESMEEVLTRHHHLTLKLGDEQRINGNWPGLLKAQARGREWDVDCYGERDAMLAAAQKMGAEVLAQRSLSLNDIFLLRSERSER